MRPEVSRRSISVCLLAGLATAIWWNEAYQTFGQFRLLTFGLVFLFLAIVTFLSRGRLQSMLLVVSALAFGLTVAEAVAALMEPKADLVVTKDYEIDAPVIGWDNGPAGTYHARRTDPRTGKVIYDVDYTIDKHHDRVTRSSNAGGSVAFFGESFTFGDGVDNAETMPQRFADLLGGRQKVVNLAVSGFSPSQVLRELQIGAKDEAIGRDPVAFVMLTGAFHVVRTACKESWTLPAPRYELKDGRLVYVGDCTEGVARLFRRFQEDTAAYRVFIKPFRLRVRRKDVETYIEIVADVARIAKSKYGVEMLVPYVGGPVPAPKALHDKQTKVLPIWAYLPGTGFDDEAIIAALKARGVKVVDMTLREEAMAGKIIGIPGDGHPTPFANRRRAEMVLNALRTIQIHSVSVPTADAEPSPEQQHLADKP